MQNKVLFSLIFITDVYITFKHITTDSVVSINSMDELVCIQCKKENCLSTRNQHYWYRLYNDYPFGNFMIVSALSEDSTATDGRSYRVIGCSPNESDVQWIEEEGNIVSVGDGRLVIGLSDTPSDANDVIPFILCEERFGNKLKFEIVAGKLRLTS